MKLKMRVHVRIFHEIEASMKPSSISKIFARQDLRAAGLQTNALTFMVSSDLLQPNGCLADPNPNYVEILIS